MREESIKEEPEDEEEVEAEQDEPASPKAMEVDQERTTLMRMTRQLRRRMLPAQHHRQGCRHCRHIRLCHLIQDPCRAVRPHLSRT